MRSRCWWCSRNLLPNSWEVLAGYDLAQPDRHPVERHARVFLLRVVSLLIVYLVLGHVSRSWEASDRQSLGLSWHEGLNPQFLTNAQPEDWTSTSAKRSRAGAEQ
jgi:hypothetical protein